MSVFEFLLVTVSIIIGLGIAELLGGVVRILRGELRFGALHSVWIFVVLLLQLQLLWTRWELRVRVDWLFSEFLLFALSPLVLYLAAAILFPDQGTTSDLKKHLLDRRIPFFGLLAALMVVYSLDAWVLYGESVGTLPDVSRAFQAMVLVALAAARQPKLQWGLTALALGQVTFFITRFTFGLNGSP